MGLCRARSLPSTLPSSETCDCKQSVLEKCMSIARLRCVQCVHIFGPEYLNSARHSTTALLSHQQLRCRRFFVSGKNTSALAKVLGRGAVAPVPVVPAPADRKVPDGTDRMEFLHPGISSNE